MEWNYYLNKMLGPHKSLTFLNEMQFMSIEPNSVTMVNVLPASANLLALDQDKYIHG